MKLIFSFTTISLILFFTSCSKKNNAPPFKDYLRFKMDGVQVECTEHLYASYVTTTSPDVRIGVSGNWSGGAIELEIDDNPNVITTRSYPFEIGKTRTTYLYLNSGTYGAGSVFGYPAIDGIGQITITEISNAFVKGNFEFTTPPNQFTGLVKTVTNGEFHIKR